MPECRYLVGADEYETGIDPRRTRPEPSPPMMCVWAHYHPAAVEKLADTPPWLIKAALAADQWRPGQCDRCPCFERGAPVELPRAAA